MHHGRLRYVADVTKDRRAGRAALERLDKTVTEILDITGNSEDELVAALTGADEPAPSVDPAAERDGAAGT